MSKGNDEQTEGYDRGAQPIRIPVNSDRNLLFGILALQMDFIDREQLIAAMRQWVFEKRTPLGEVLCRSQAVTEEEFALLTALVEKHLENHDQSTQRSLGALSSIGELRGELGKLSDDELNTSLTHVAQDRPVGAGSDDVDPAGVSFLTSSEMRFRILRFHDKGGLGQIFVARDEELGRDVALKEIRPEWADDENCRARFTLEAEVTGGLEHPGIVPVYGLGQYRDGRPFYAMRFIRGDSLRAAIQRFHQANRNLDRDSGERQLELRRLLGRFNDVCQAIEYAHSRGVLHRDLKPGNVMLGKYGETLVVDWGLAKTTGHQEPATESMDSVLQPRSSSGSAPTEMGFAIGTPAYMSPEQAAGRWDLLGRASDIYGLGATLYHLLTGRAPIEATGREDARQRAQQGDVPPPREVEPSIPRPLAAICQKAMSRQQEDRYDSAAALAEDVEHWLADEPVSAYREPVLTRFARWERRHKPVVAAAAMVLLTTLIGLAVGNLLLRRANQLTMQQRQRAQSMVDDYFTLVSEEQLLDEPGMQPLRQKLLERAREYYQAFVDDRSEDSAARFELAKAYIRLGMINDRIGTPDKAISRFRAAQRILERLVQLNPDNSEHETELARACCNLASTIWHEGEFDQAMELYETAGGLTRDLAQMPAENVQPATWYVTSLIGIGSLRSWRGEHQAALDEYSRAIELCQKLVDTDAAEPRHRTSLALLYVDVALSNVSLNRREEAFSAFYEACKILEEIVRQWPQSVRYRKQLAVACLKLGMEQSFFGRHDDAEKSLQRAQTLTEALHREHPRDKNIRANLAETYLEQGVLLWHRKRLADAQPLFEKAAALYQDLATEDAQIPAYSFGQAKSLNGLAYSQHIGGQQDKAIDTNKRSIAIFSKLGEQYPLRSDYQSQLGGNLHNYSMILLDMGEFEEALATFQRAIVHQQQALDIMPDAPAYRLFLSNHYSGLAAVQRSLGMISEAVDTTLRRQEMWPGNAIQLYNVACELAQCSQLVGEGKDELSDSERAERARLAEMAVTALRESVDAGFAEKDVLENDPDLDSIRSLESFKAVMKRLESI